MTGARVSLVMGQALKIWAWAGSGLEPFLKLPAWAFDRPSNLLKNTKIFRPFPKSRTWSSLVGLGVGLDPSLNITVCPEESENSANLPQISQ